MGSSQSSKPAGRIPQTPGAEQEYRSTTRDEYSGSTSAVQEYSTLAQVSVAREYRSTGVRRTRVQYRKDKQEYISTRNTGERKHINMQRTSVQEYSFSYRLEVSKNKFTRLYC